MDLSGKYITKLNNERLISYPTEGHPHGENVLTKSVVNKYQMGDHLVDGGPGVGLFWASAVQDIRSLQPKPLEHAMQMIQLDNTRLDAMHT
jgi:hypothetical protein